MTPIPECCTPDDSVIEVARVMAQHDVGLVPIIESQDTRRIVGIVSMADLARATDGQRLDDTEKGITER